MAYVVPLRKVPAIVGHQLTKLAIFRSLRRLFAFFGDDEFYQKGCQEKSSASTGGEKFSRDPAHWNLASLEKLDLYPFW